MLAGRKTLITGGAGLIGSHIADLLVAEDVAEIVVVDDLSRGRLENLAVAEASGKLRFIEGDIRDRDLLADAMKGVDTVFHQAAIRITRCAAEPRVAHEVLATGTLNVVEAASQAGVRKVVAASSASIYGQAESFPTDEKHHPYANDTIYGAAKSYLEGMLRAYHEMVGLDYVALRYFNVYGPRMDIFGVYTEVMVRWMERIEAGEPPLIFGDGSQTMDFVFITDIARANLLAAKADVTDEVFNVARGEETSLRELAELMMRVMGAHEGLAPEMREARKVAPVTRRIASTAKAERLLGFRAEIGIEEGIELLVSWWRGERAKAAAAAAEAEGESEGSA